MKSALVIVMSIAVVFHLAVGCCATFSLAAEQTCHAHDHSDAGSEHDHDHVDHSHASPGSLPDSHAPSPCAALGCAAVLSAPQLPVQHDSTFASACLATPGLLMAGVCGEAPPAVGCAGSRRYSVLIFLDCQRLLI